MAPEELISTLLREYGNQILFTFITLVITGFILTVLRNFIQDLVNYFRARMSDIGRGQRIYLNNEILVIEKNHF